MKNLTMKRFLLGLLLAAAAFRPAVALAVDPPRWVAALHIAGQEAVGLRWSPIPGATGYKLLRSQTAGSGHKEIAAVAVPQHFDKDIVPGETYYYVLQSVAGADVSALSEERSVAIPGVKKQQAIGTPVLNKPVLSQVTEFGKTVSKVGLSWAPVPGAIAYNVMRSNTKGAGHAMLTSVSETNFVDADIQVGKSYYYQVSALDQSFQESPLSAEAGVEEVKELEAKAARAPKKEKIKIMLRKTRPVGVVTEGAWGKLEQPSGIALAPNGDLYVVDGATKQVYVFNAALEFLFAFGEDEKLETPQDIAVSDEGDVVVVQQSATLLLYSADGRLKKTIDLAELMSAEDEDRRSVSKAEAGSGGRWYLSNARAKKIFVVDADFKLLETIGSPGTELDQFMQPSGVYEERKSGTLVASDTLNFMLKVFKGGKATMGTGSYGNSVGQFGRIVDAIMTSEGHVLTADFLNANIQGFDLEGKFLYVLGVEAMNAQISLKTPTSIVERAGKLYVCEKLAGRVSVFELLAEIGPPQLKK